MRAFFAAPNILKQDEIAARQLQALNEHRRPRDKPLRLARAAKLLLRCFQDPRARLVEVFSRSDWTVHRLDGALLGSQCWS
jgi:hypothetical protein